MAHAPVALVRRLHLDEQGREVGREGPRSTEKASTRAARCGGATPSGGAQPVTTSDRTAPTRMRDALPHGPDVTPRIRSGAARHDQERRVLSLAWMQSTWDLMAWASASMQSATADTSC